MVGIPFGTLLISVPFLPDLCALGKFVVAIWSLSGIIDYRGSVDVQRGLPIIVGDTTVLNLKAD